MNNNIQFLRTRNIQLSSIKQIELLASKIPDSISLAQGIPDFDTPMSIKRRAENALRNGDVAKYTLSPGLPELRELVEINLAKEEMYYDWETEILITAGAIEALTAALLTITEPGDEVIIPGPTYASYEQAIKLCGCLPVYVPLNEDNNWSFELEKFKQAVTAKTKAIFYCNPNNPTGTVYSKEQLLELAGLAEKNNLFLISDDVYKDFIFDDAKIFSLAQLSGLRKRLIRIFSFSKSYAMTGWRVAYLHSDSSIVSEILKVHDCLVTCAPAISQYAAMGALEIAENDVKKFKAEFTARRDLVCQRLDKLKDYTSYVRPTSAYFVFPKIIKGETDSWKFCLDVLNNAKVALVPGVAFGPIGEGHFRISFSRNQNDINGAFDRLEKYFKL